MAVKQGTIKCDFKVLFTIMDVILIVNLIL